MPPCSARGLNSPATSPLWLAIRNGTDALSFNNYLRFMNELFCGEPASDLLSFERQRFTEKEESVRRSCSKRRFLPFTDTDAYRVAEGGDRGVRHGELRHRRRRRAPSTRTGTTDYLDAARSAVVAN